MAQKTIQVKNIPNEIFSNFDLFCDGIFVFINNYYIK